MHTKLYIACYQSIRHPDDLNIIHWSLIVLRHGHSLAARLRTYQIVQDIGGPWRLGNRDVSLLSTGRFYCCVYIGRTHATQAQLENRLEVASPLQGDTPSLPTPAREGRPWTCGQWIIRCLREMLVDNGLFHLEPADPDTFYRRVVAIAREMRLNPEAGEITVDGRTVDVHSVNGVEVIHIWD